MWVRTPKKGPPVLRPHKSKQQASWVTLAEWRAPGHHSHPRQHPQAVSEERGDEGHPSSFLGGEPLGLPDFLLTPQGSSS